MPVLLNARDAHLMPSLAPSTQGCHVQRNGDGRGGFQFNENLHGAASVRNFQIWTSPNLDT